MHHPDYVTGAYATGANNQQQPNYDLRTEVNKVWSQTAEKFANIDPKKEDWRKAALPLARIKKIMKVEDELRSDRGERKLMVSAEVPLLFNQACSLFIADLSVRGWACTLGGRRRTLAKTDIYTASNGSDAYDFLIDIVPRVEVPNFALDPQFGGRPPQIKDDEDHPMSNLKIAAGEETPPPNNSNNEAGFDSYGIAFLQQVLALGYGTHLPAQSQESINRQVTLWQKFGEARMREREWTLEEQHTKEEMIEKSEAIKALAEYNKVGKIAPTRLIKIADPDLANTLGSDSDDEDGDDDDKKGDIAPVKIKGKGLV